MRLVLIEYDIIEWFVVQVDSYPNHPPACRPFCDACAAAESARNEAASKLERARRVSKPFTQLKAKHLLTSPLFYGKDASRCTF